MEKFSEKSYVPASPQLPGEIRDRDISRVIRCHI